MRIKGMNANLKSFDFFKSSPYQYQKKCVQNNKENMHADIRE